MKVNEIWVMKKHIIGEYDKMYDDIDKNDLSFVKKSTTESTKIKILDIIGDTIFFVYIYSGNTCKLNRKKFISEYEKFYLKNYKICSYS